MTTCRLLISFFSLLPIFIYAQTDRSQFIIKGRVVELETGSPIISAAVFLENTTIGTTTDQEGNFIIRSGKFGTYNLIASSLGYELESVSFRASKAETFEFTFKLKQKTIFLNEISVRSQVPEDWKKYIEIFKEEFLGKTEYSKQTTIINPEVINFRMEEKARILKAYTDSMIIVENKALGYRLNVLLDQFSFNKEGLMRYFFHCKFEELIPESNKQKEEWEENRKECYLGSQKYFFTSLLDKSAGEKFLLYAKDPRRFNISQWIRISPDDLKLNYDKENETVSLVSDKVYKVQCFKNQKISYIRPLEDKISIDLYGNPDNTFIAGGYWKELRMADLLPFDYVYDSNSH